MAADWEFDHSGVGDELHRFAEEANDALVAARGALRRFDGELATAGDRRAVRKAAAQVTDVRRRLHELDRDLFAEAEGLLEELLEQADAAALRLAPQEA